MLQVKMKYREISGFEFTQAMQKIGSTPTTAQKAAQIRRITKEIEAARKVVVAEFERDIMQVYGAKNEDGTLKRPEGEPTGFEPLEGKHEEIMSAQTAFGEREVTLNILRPLTPATLSDMKLSAKDLDALKGLFSEEDGPGVPGGPFVPAQQANVQSIRPQ